MLPLFLVTEDKILELVYHLYDNSLYSSHSLYYELISRASFDIVLSIGAVLLLAIWPNILPLQQHLAMAQIIPGSARAPPYGSAPANTIAAGAPANTTAAGAPANTIAAGAPANTIAAGAPAHVANTTAEAPAGEEVVPHWYGGAPCSHNSCHD
jgi:hypothetical protein